MPVSLFQYMITQNNTIREIIPSPEVRDVIAGFYMLPAEEAGLAFSDGMPSIAFTEGHVEVITEKGTYTISKAWLSSQYLENIRLSHHRVLVVRFHPVSFYQLFNLKPAMLRSRSIWDLPAALGDNATALLNCTGQKEIEAFVLTLKGKHTYTNALLQQTLHLIQQERGNVAIEDVGAAMRVNYKWLERNFSQHIGISPKEYARLQRFMHAYVCVITQASDISGIAISNGYYDQNHFSKEFKKFTGQPPLKYLRKQGLDPALFPVTVK